MNKLTTVAALAFSALGIAFTSASAQFVSVSPGDLVLGFRVTDNTGMGATTDLEVDLGSSSLFTTTASFSSLPSLAVADLVATYGSNWATRDDLTWGVAGVTSTSANSFDATSSAGAQKESSNLSGPHGTILSMVNGLGNLAPTSHSTESGTVDKSVSNSYFASVNPGLGNADYGYFTPSSVTEIDGGNGTTIGSDELFGYVQARSGSGTDLGTFSLDAAGDFSYNGVAAAVIPEPSTYAMMLGAFGLLGLALRLRRSSTLG